MDCSSEELIQGNTLEHCIDIIACAEIVAHIEYGLSSGELSHESCPEIGSHDWSLIEERIKQILNVLSTDDTSRVEAYELLVKRSGRG